MENLKKFEFPAINELCVEIGSETRSREDWSKFISSLQAFCSRNTKLTRLLVDVENSPEATLRNWNLIDLVVELKKTSIASCVIGDGEHENWVKLSLSSDEKQVKIFGRILNGEEKKFF